ncbi:MAG TPA: hypothetical protein VMI32_00745 [Candidatus Solibacter sp.]|nr:hypothetical protein [Candidatus Solibacter sp.]
MSSATGVLNKEDALAHQNRLRADPDFDPAYSQLLDFRHVTQIELTAADIQQLAVSNIFSSESRRAFLVPNDLAFGLARMYEMLRESAGERGIRIFRDLDEALGWVLSNQESS